MKVAVLSHVAVVASPLSIALSSNAVRADELESATSLIRQMHADTPFPAADSDKPAVDQSVAERSDAGASTWDWRLTGIVLGPNVRIALFAQVGKTRAVPEGKAIDGWIVTSVERGSVTLSAAGQIRVIQLEDMSDDEEAEAARRRAEEIARVDAPALAASRQQDRERDEAMDDLAEATRRMTGR